MSSAARILVIGADSTIGSALINYLITVDKPVLGTSRRMTEHSDFYLNLADPPSLWVMPENISNTFICAAETSQGRCQQYPDETKHINVRKTEQLAKVLVAAGSRVFFLSTNLVYDGSIPFRKATDVPCPLTEYGAQKAEAEKRLLSIGSNVVIVRLTKVLHKNMTLLNLWRESLAAEKDIHPYSNMVLAPISVGFVTRALAQLAEINYAGIIQLSGAADITYEVLARHIADRLGASQSLILPTMANQNNNGNKVIPKHSTLDMSIAAKLLDMQPPNVWQSIDNALL